MYSTSINWRFINLLYLFFFMFCGFRKRWRGMLCGLNRYFRCSTIFTKEIMNIFTKSELLTPRNVN